VTFFTVKTDWLMSYSKGGKVQGLVDRLKGHIGCSKHEHGVAEASAENAAGHPADSKACHAESKVCHADKKACPDASKACPAGGACNKVTAAAPSA
jgi:hypothetical protein